MYRMIRRSLESYLKLESGHSQSSIHKYLLEFDRLLRFLDREGIALEEVGHRDLRIYVGERAGDLSRPTYANIVALLRTIFAFLDYEEIVPGNPAEKLKIPRSAARQTLPVFLSETQQRRLREYLDALKSNFTNDRDRTIIYSILYTGMRTSELCNLRRQDVAEDAGAIKLTRKGGKEQLVPVSARLQQIWDRHWNSYLQHIDSPWFVSRKQGQQLTAYLVWQRVGVHLERAGVNTGSKRGAHVLRHTFASNLVRKGVNLIEIQQLLGHSDVAITQIYTHTTPEGLREAVSVLD